jgi:hypothetical protein
MVVRSYSADEVVEIYKLRAVLEPLPASLARQRASAEELEEIAQIQGKLKTSVDTNAHGRRPQHPTSRGTRQSVYRASHGTLRSSSRGCGVPSPLASSGYRLGHRRQALTRGCDRKLLARDNSRPALLMRLHIRAGAESHQTGLTSLRLHRVRNHLRCQNRRQAMTTGS